MLYLAFTLLSLTVLEPSRLTHVRPETPVMRRLVTTGAARSPTLRSLMARLERSDVVAYVAEDESFRPKLDGRLAFLGSGGGTRYVRILIATRAQESRNIATLAHELQHAVEIAERPSIVDQDSMARAYARIGHGTPAKRVFDTVQAIEIGHRVWREVTPW